MIAKDCRLCLSQLHGLTNKVCTGCAASIVARSKIIVYVVVFISTDDMTYHDTIYCDTFRSIVEAQKYLEKLIKDTGWTSDSKDEYEIKEITLD